MDDNELDNEAYILCQLKAKCTSIHYHCCKVQFIDFLFPQTNGNRPCANLNITTFPIICALCSNSHCSSLTKRLLLSNKTLSIYAIHQ